MAHEREKTYINRDINHINISYYNFLLVSLN